MADSSFQPDLLAITRELAEAPMPDVPVFEWLLWQAMLDAILEGDVPEVESLEKSLLSFGYVVEMDGEWVWLRHLGLDQIFAVVLFERVEA